MKHIVEFRLANVGQPDRIIGRVDDEGVEALSGEPPLPKCTCAPAGADSLTASHKPSCPLHPDNRRNRPEPEPDDYGPADGPFPVCLYDPVEIYTAAVPMETRIAGQAAYGIAEIPKALRHRFVWVHYERVLWDSELHHDDPGDPVVALYAAARERAEAEWAAAPAGPKERSRIRLS